MKINLEILEASYIYGKDSIEDLNTKALVPKMATRRRLTRASKIAIYLASKVTYDNERIVFGSSYGELPSTENILNSINKKDQISPTQFQNSVYNIPVAYLSIISNNTNEIMTISSDDKTSLDILKAGAIKALDGDEIILMVVEALNIEATKEVNNCIDYLECGIILKVKLSENEANLQVTENNNLRLPNSTVHLYNLANSFDKYKKNIVEVKI
jgi:hypothetical protein